MIRLRFGQTWRREGAGAVDSVALTLHGLDLLVGANEEHLPEVVESWSSAWQALGSAQGEIAQVSLPEARLELVMRRLSPSALELQVVSLARPARLMRAPVQVETLDLRKAWVAGVSALWRDLQDSGDMAIAERVLGALERVRQVAPPLPVNEHRGPGFGYRSFARADFQMAFELWDSEERLLAHRSDGPAPLGTLLVPGTVSLKLPERVVHYTPESVFLFALELSRQAQELLDANGSAPNALELGGAGPSLSTRSADAAVHWPPYLPAMFQLGVDLAFAVESRNAAQRDNPYLRELVERCHTGLRALKGHAPTPQTGTEPAVPERRARAAPAIEEQGKLRRLKFVQRYETRLAAPDAALHLIPVSKGSIWVSAPHWAERYDASGAQTQRLASEHGVAVSPTDWAIVSEGNRLLGYTAGRKGAVWMQPHDGLPLGPRLLLEGDHFFTQSETRAAVAYWAETGREAWRFAPFRPGKIQVAILGGRAVVASDAGDLFGLSSLDGQLRYRFEAPLPFIVPPIPLGKNFVAVLNSSGHSALVCADAENGQLQWTRELAWSRASAPVIAGGRVWLAGQHGTEGKLLCLAANGEERFEVSLPFSDERYFLLAVGRSVLVTGQHGGAARFSPKGALEYALPPAGEPAWRMLPPKLSRGVVFLPGDPLRAIEAKSGRVLAELRGGPALLAYETDRHLNVYTLDEGGMLKAFKWISHFAVVE